MFTKKLFSLALAALVGMSFSQASAATLAPGSTYTVNNAAPVGALVDLSSIPTLLGNNATTANYIIPAGTASFTHADMVYGSVGGQYRAPDGIGATEPYINVYGSSNGSATFTFTKPVTALGLIWGSIDAYNTLQITTADGTNEFVGADITAALINASVAVNPGLTSTVFNFFNATGISEIKFLSTNNSFEVARLSAVPLPAALPLFGAALGGLALVRRRKTA